VVHIARRHGRRYIAEIALVDPSLLDDKRDALIQPYTLFEGVVSKDGETVKHRRVGSVRADTQMAARLNDTPDIDARRWLET
jgi:hypothetical protein